MKYTIIKTDGSSYHAKLMAQCQEYPYEDGPDMRAQESADKAYVDRVVRCAKRAFYIENEELRKTLSNTRKIIWCIFVAIIILGVKVFLADSGVGT